MFYIRVCFFLFRNQEFRHQTFLENREFLCSLQFLSKLFRAYCQTDNCGSVWRSSKDINVNVLKGLVIPDYVCYVKQYNQELP